MASVIVGDADGDAVADDDADATAPGAGASDTLEPEGTRGPSTVVSTTPPKTTPAAAHTATAVPAHVRQTRRRARTRI
ncbi:hypothetical protein [Rugosimonospora africana]|uniref:Uncharacterized protein n=1 Tax=Rugosimonospora africana TaxID=556532 RepID=A0A8J3QS57_9ACTN|nr:hypothetical protein [Rugosimonospora africana]GIH15272.1 hypothetical protein Raf01_34440 [Rugosimonospora africana]